MSTTEFNMIRNARHGCIDRGERGRKRNRGLSQEEREQIGSFKNSRWKNPCVEQQEAASEWDSQGASWKVRAYSPGSTGVLVTGPDSVCLAGQQPLRKPAGFRSQKYCYLTVALWGCDRWHDALKIQQTCNDPGTFFIFFFNKGNCHGKG